VVVAVAQALELQPLGTMEPTLLGLSHLLVVVTAAMVAAAAKAMVRMERFLEEEEEGPCAAVPVLGTVVMVLMVR
jgi:hypothetical protein